MKSEDFIPEREDFARVYTMLRREYRAGRDTLCYRDMIKRINQGNQVAMNYTKFKYVLRILDELRICRIDEPEEDTYSFDVYFNASKTNIEKSSILKKLKSQCADRAM